MEMSLLRFLSESVMADDVGLFSDQSTIVDFDLLSFSSITNSSSYSLFSPEEKPVDNLRSEQVCLSSMPTKQPKIESICYPYPNSFLHPSTHPKIISFKGAHLAEKNGTTCIDSKPKMDDLHEGGADFSLFYRPSKKRTFSATSITPLHAQDHVLAERKRREKLGRLFITLAATIPGLKKLDKASVLEDAIKYTKELQERVQSLEEDLALKSMVFGKRYRVEGDDDNDLNSETPPFDRFDGKLPEVEARVLGKHILLRIHCEKCRGVIVKVFNEIEKFNLTVLTHSVLPFGNSILDVTVAAKMDAAFSFRIEDLTRNLRRGLVDSL